MPFQEEKASDTCSKHDETNDDSDDDSILDILDCCTDEEENAQPADELNAELVQTYSVVDPIPVDLASYTYTCNDILNKNTSKMQELVVWTFRRPNCSKFSDTIDGDQFVLDLKKTLVTVNDPLYNNHLFWDWLSHLSHEKLERICIELRQHLEHTGNRYIVEHNAVTSYCTGSHNNVSMLGSLMQAKTAVQYICPYIMKAKYPLEQCLIIIRNVLQYNKSHPSVSQEDRGTASRDAKYFLQGILNWMNVLAEISDYQVAAKLINFPPVIFTDCFAYVNPGPYMAYAIQKEIDKDFTYRIMDHLNNQNTLPSAYPIESLLESLGHVQCFHISDGETERRCLMPTVMLYEFRSPQLEFMNRVEFECLVHIANKREQCESSKNLQFELSPHSGLASSKALFLSAKQRIPIFTRRVPAHPGTRPTQDGSELLQWKEKADAYARYFLIMYQPEPLIYNHAPVHIPLQYTWDAFQNWIEEQRQSHNAFGICRLMLMHRRMQSMYTDHQMQLIFNDYRTSSRDLWSTETTSRIATSLQNENRPNSDDVDDDQWNISNSILPLRATEQIQKHLKFTDMQLKSFQSLMSPLFSHNMAWNDTPVSHGNASCTNPSGLSPPLEPKQVQLCFRAIRQDDQLNQNQACNLPSELNNTAPLSGSTNIDTEFLIDNQQQPTLDMLIHKYFPLQPTPSQLEFFTLYAQYFLHPENTTLRPPDVVLATGAAGTGKTVAVNAIIDAAILLGFDTIWTACNNINAADIQGHTTASLVNLQNTTLSLNGHQLDKFIQLTKILDPSHKILLIIFDEVSTECPEYLAKISHACQQALQVFDKDFGGLPVLLLGDLGQMPPVKKQALHTAAITLAK